MTQQSFSVAGSSLDLLKPGEQGIVKFFSITDTTIQNKLTAMGLLPGSKILLEQRFPSFVIKVGQSRFALDQQIARSIYVRLLN